MAERPTHFESPKIPAFQMICETCNKVLYEPTEDNMITRRVAEMRGIDHSQFYNPPHRVVVITKAKPC